MILVNFSLNSNISIMSEFPMSPLVTHFVAWFSQADNQVFPLLLQDSHRSGKGQENVLLRVRKFRNFAKSQD